MGREAKQTIRVRDPERTRSEILAVAVSEFAEHGFHGARVDRITRRANCNSRMLYHYFGNKEGLYLAVLDEVFARLRGQEARLTLDVDQPAVAIRRLVEFTHDYFADNETFLKLTRSENMLNGRFIGRSQMIPDMSQPLIDAIGRVIDRGVVEGVFTARCDPLQLYVTIVALSAHHLNNAATLSTVFGTDLTAEDWRAARRAHAVAIVLRFLGVAPDAAGPDGLTPP